MRQPPKQRTADCLWVLTWVLFGLWIAILCYFNIFS
jgi:hypothetical protein